jgi:hypothetical protein
MRGAHCALSRGNRHHAYHTYHASDGHEVFNLLSWAELQDKRAYYMATNSSCEAVCN